ncbi:unnamed protein product [marine sediment metagenome]|uniref:Uncharacterized protein n=1 Tax=marine sediment metagenome TaxID=412755 RepID=X1T4B1_9ZZZZ
MDKTGLEKEVLENMLDRLMNNAVIIGTPSRSIFKISYLY